MTLACGKQGNRGFFVKIRRKAVLLQKSLAKINEMAEHISNILTNQGVDIATLQAFLDEKAKQGILLVQLFAGYLKNVRRCQAKL